MNIIEPIYWKPIKIFKKMIVNFVMWMKVEKGYLLAVICIIIWNENERDHEIIYISNQLYNFYNDYSQNE